MANVNVHDAANGAAGNRARQSSADAFRLMAQGLAQIQEANGMLQEGFREQEQRPSEALQQEQRSQEATRVVVQQQEQGQQDKITEVKQMLEGKIARVSEAVCNLTLTVNEGLQRVGQRMDALESRASGGDHVALELLEGRMKNLETSVQKALVSVFPRVNALLAQLENHNLAEIDPKSVSDEHPPAPTTSSSATDSSPLRSFPSTSSLRSPPRSSSPPSDRDLEQSADSGGDLCRAAEDGRVEDARRLLSSGASANFCDSDGWTPLHWAARNAHAEIVSLLVDEGADVHARDTDGNNPLHIAALYDREGECVSLLIDGAAHVDSRDKNGETPLGWASNTDNVTAIELIISALSKDAPEGLE